MAQLQYISDVSGNHTAVVIPIAEWEKIVLKCPALQSLEKELSMDNPTPVTYTMGDFKGSLVAESADALQKYVEQSRKEWEKDS